jgi:hypothetical protein
MSEASPTQRRLTILHILGTILALIMLVYLFSQQGWQEIGQTFSTIPLWRLLLALVLMMISRLAVTGRWHVLLVSAGVNISIWQSLQITFAGLFASQFLPTTIGGDVVRLAGAIRLGMNRAVSLASLIVDRLIGMAGMAMAALSLFFYLPGLITQIRLGVNLSFPKQPYVLISAAPISSNGWLRKVIRRAQQGLIRILEAVALWLKHPKGLLLSLGFTWVHMLCVFGSIALFLPPLSEHMPFGLIAGLWSLTYFITLLPISFNGLGVQELSITFLFHQFGGIQLSSALTIALLYRVLLLFASLPGVLTIPGLLAGRKELAPFDKHL